MPIGIPASKNFLSPLGYRFTLSRAPNLTFNVQSVVFPGVNLGFTELPTPFVKMPVATKIDYTALGITFRVSEDMNDYLEIYKWMVGLGAPKQFSQYKALQDARKNNPSSLETLTSDASLSILDSTMNPNVTVDFYDVFPIALSDLTMNSTDNDVNYVECTASFKFLRYEINNI